MVIVECFWTVLKVCPAKCLAGEKHKTNWLIWLEARLLQFQLENGSQSRTSCRYRVILVGVQRKAARYVHNVVTLFKRNINAEYIIYSGSLWKTEEPSLGLLCSTNLFIIIIIVHINLNSYLHPSGTITRGHQQRYRQLHARINSYHHSFLPASIRDWNSLPTEVVTSSSLDDFISIYTITVSVWGPGRITEAYSTIGLRNAK